MTQGFAVFQGRLRYKSLPLLLADTDLSDLKSNIEQPLVERLGQVGCPIPVISCVFLMSRE